jgi:hypothetical protein
MSKDFLLKQDQLLQKLTEAYQFNCISVVFRKVTHSVKLITAQTTASIAAKPQSCQSGLITG